MTKYYVDGSDLTSVANEIRSKGETTEPLVFPAGFISAIEDISGEDSGIRFEEPLERDFSGGYVSASSAPGSCTWTIDASSDSESTIYKVERDHWYLLCLDSSISNRFRVAVFAEDVRNAESIVSGYAYTAQNAPRQNAGIYFQNNHNTYYDYLVVQTTNNGTTGIMTYLIDITDMIAEART